MTAYLKKPFDQEAEAGVWANLSTMDDARIPGAHSYARVLPEPQCDWCGDNQPVWVYAARRTSNGEDRLCWRWAACERCDRMVTHANWDALHRRMVVQFKRAFGQRMVVEFGPRPVPNSLIDEAVYQSLDQFHRYHIKANQADEAILKVLFPGGV